MRVLSGRGPGTGTGTISGTGTGMSIRGGRIGGAGAFGSGWRASGSNPVSPQTFFGGGAHGASSAEAGTGATVPNNSSPVTAGVKIAEAQRFPLRVEPRAAAGLPAAALPVALFPNTALLDYHSHRW